MFKKNTNKVISSILTASFIISNAVFIPNFVSADNIQGNNSYSEFEFDKEYEISESDYKLLPGSSDNYYLYEFSPSETGFYRLETSGSSLVILEEIQQDGYVEYVTANNSVIGLNDLNLSPIIHISYSWGSCLYQLEKDHIYYIASYNNVLHDLVFAIRHLQKYIYIHPHDDVVAIKDKTFSCTMDVECTVPYDNMSFAWYINDKHYTSDTPSITLETNDVFDFDNGVIEGCNYWMSFYVYLESESRNYTTDVWFYVYPYTSYLSSVTWANPSSSLNLAVPYNVNDDSSYYYFSVDAGCKTNDVCSINYQWYKIDSESNYVALPGQNSSILYLSYSFDLFGEPDVQIDYDNSISLYSDVVCVVTFDNGKEISEKNVQFKISYNLYSNYEGEYNSEKINYGSVISLPYGSIDDSNLPEGFSYRYLWVKCDFIPDCQWDSYFSKYGNPWNDYFGDEPSIIGQGKTVLVDTSDLEILNEDGNDVSYIACVYEPIYNGSVCNSDCLEKGVRFYKIEYNCFSNSVWAQVSDLSDYCGIRYHEQFDNDCHFVVDSGCDIDVDYDASFQWYKIDYERDEFGNANEIYVPLEGQTNDSLYLCEVSDEIGDPDFYVSDDNYTSLVRVIKCIVSFDNGVETVNKEVPFYIHYSVSVNFEGQFNNYCQMGDIISLPNGGSFIEDSMPEEVTYKYTWYDLDHVYEDYYYGRTFYGESEEWTQLLDESIGDDSRIIGNGSSIEIDTSNLYYFERNGRKYSYIACVYEPTYNGVRLDGYSFISGIRYFKIEYIPFSEKIWAYGGNSWSSCMIPFSTDGYDVDTTFNVYAGSSVDCSISYQWFEKDSYLEASGNYDNEKDLYIKLDDQVNSSLKLNDVIHDPYVIIENNTYEMFIDYVCVVSFDNGKEIIEREFNYRVTFVTDVEIDYSKNVSINFGKVIDLPLNSEFVETDLPEGLSYRYTWLNLSAAPDGCTMYLEGHGQNIDLYSNFSGNYVNLGYGKSIEINPSDLIKQLDESGTVYTYVACVYEPVFNGKRYYGHSLGCGYVVYRLNDISSIPITVTSQPTDFNGPVGVTASFDIEAEGNGLTYQWQVFKNGLWKNTSLPGVTTKSLSVGIVESRDGMQFRCVIKDKNGNKLISDTAILTVDPMAITSQPSDYTGAIGDTATFKVTAAGDCLTYQWQVYKNGAWKNTSLTGNTTSKLSVGIVGSRNGMKFRCIISAPNGTVLFSNPAILTVEPISITVQPEDCTGSIGETVEFSVEAAGENLTYQWQVYKNGAWKNTSLPGSTTDSLSVGIVESRDGMKFRCVVKDANGNKVISDEVSITVVAPSSKITSEPEDYIGAIGDIATFSVEAEGDSLTYQWQVYKNGAWKNTSLAGNNTDTLKVEVVASRDGMTFRCVISDANGNTLTSDEVSITIETPSITITSEPEDYAGAIGDIATFNVEAEGEDLTYQWQVYKNGAWKNTSLSGNKTDTLNVEVVASRDGMQFRCIISDAKGNTLTSDEVSITIEEPAITITSEPENYAGAIGDIATFSVEAEGEGLTYQWQVYKNGAWKNTSLTGNDKPSLIIDVLASRDGMQFRCVVSDSNGNEVATEAVTITVNT